MKLSDYVVSFLAEQGIEYIFGVTGGAVAHLFDSAYRSTQIKPIFNHHEQASAFAAEAYSRVNGLGAAFVTTGPGGTNTVTGVLAAWMDSVPCIYISGQARLGLTSRGTGVRQIGVQEFDIVSLVSHITKYAVMLEDPKMIKYHLQKAVYLATTGRPGPVWIDIPQDCQWASIEPDELLGFVTPTTAISTTSFEIEHVAEMIKAASYPLVLAGYGIRAAHAEEEFAQLVNTLKLPFVTSWNMRDILPTSHELNLGCVGFEGERGGNLAVHNCDLLLCLGSHLSIPLTGQAVDLFAPNAKIVMVDVDSAELNHRTVRVDVPVLCDVKVFLSDIIKKVEKVQIDAWRWRCSQYKVKYNIVPPEWLGQREYVNPYVFVDALSRVSGNNDIIVVDGGGTFTQITFQTFKVKEGQRLFMAAGVASMGSGIPESIGASFASGRGRIISMCGDGSFQFNIQELQTVVHHNLPIKMFVLNNGGYLAIRHTQDGFLGSRYIGSSPVGGLSLPDFRKIAEAYGIRTTCIDNHDYLDGKILNVLNHPGPMVCEVMIAREQQVMPRQGFNMNPDGTGVPRSLADMYPYLSRDELSENMVRADE